MTYQMPPQPEPPVTQARPKRRRRWPWVLVGLVVLLIVIAVASNNNGGTTPTAAPGATATPAAPAAVATKAPTTPPPAPPSVWHGKGDDVVAIHGPTGAKIVHFSCPQCTSNTTVKTDGSESLLVNTIGPYDGQQWADVHDGSTTTKITIQADSSWTLTVGGLSLARVAHGGVAGRGDDVVLLETPTSQAAITNNGSGNFVVQDVNTSNYQLSLDINEIGSYSGTVPLAGPTLVQITSDGGWSINPS